MLTATEVDKLQALLAKATPGEWYADDRIEQWQGGQTPGCMVFFRHGQSGHPIANCSLSSKPTQAAVTNAALIAGAVMALPELLRVYRAWLDAEGRTTCSPPPRS